MKNDAFHILWYVNLYLYLALMECEINTNTNRKYDTNETGPSVIGDMPSDTVSEFRVPCSEGSGYRNSRTGDDYSTMRQCSEIAGSADLPKTIPIETRSYGEYKNIHDDEIDYTDSFSWLIYSKFGSLFNVDESQQQVEETTCPGMY
jgi:hypothetical protein